MEVTIKNHVHTRTQEKGAVIPETEPEFMAEAWIDSVCHGVKDTK